MLIAAQATAGQTPTDALTVNGSMSATSLQLNGVSVPTVDTTSLSSYYTKHRQTVGINQRCRGPGSYTPQTLPTTLLVDISVAAVYAKKQKYEKHIPNQKQKTKKR